ncbi:MAG: alpha/beta hydrolase [Bacteroidia bacterium]|nr:alpha/beta hydrolase [Bacteroidia bacterium]
MKISLGLLPGLGFTKEIFSRLKIQAEELFYLEWIEPEVNESLDSYALRMGSDLKRAKYPLVLLGHSFGGMMASEVSRQYEAQLIILISSVKNREEIPFRFKSIAPLGLHRLFTKELSLKSLPYWGERFGYKKGEEQELFRKMVSRQTNSYLQWALKNLSLWDRNISREVPYFHFHGDHDKTFPVQHIKPPFTLIEKGSHMMVYNQAWKLSQLINTSLETVFNPA